MRLIKRIVLGIILGIVIGYLINIIISIIINDGQFYVASPYLYKITKTELSAVILQTLISMMIGIFYSLIDIVYDIKNLTILKKTIIHYVLTFSFLVVVAYVFWIPHNLKSLIAFMIIYTLIYIVIWIINYIILKIKINNINQKLIQN